VMQRRQTKFTAVIDRDDGGFVALCPEVDIASQGETVDEARRNLVEAIEGFFEVASEAEIATGLDRERVVEQVEVSVGFSAAGREATCNAYWSNTGSSEGKPL
jgi:predicted RNase H-like HicB family nuclease